MRPPAYGKADEAGDAEAINNLATLHMHGAGVAVDIDRAMTMYQRAATQTAPHGVPRPPSARAISRTPLP
ncbi:hypothetical protein GCM10028794_28610 [Silanimonas algicola]